MTEQQALQKLASLCSAAEQCSHDMLQKMQRWEISDDAQARIMEYLIKEKYVDDARFCRFFINDKLRFNKWGRRKIEQALWQKNISADISAPLFDDIETEEWIAVLRPLMKQKERSIKANSEYERATKLVRFALGRGFTYDIIRECIATDVDIDD